MSDKWAGITTLSDTVTLVVIEYDRDEARVIADETFGLQQGERPDAYRLIYERVLNFLRENSIGFVALKGSAVSVGGTKAVHLEAAELRGVVITAAAQSGAKVTTLTKSLMSRKFGKRKVDQYVADNDFWEEKLGDGLRKGSRESALLILAARQQ